MGASLMAAVSSARAGRSSSGDGASRRAARSRSACRPPRRAAGRPARRRARRTRWMLWTRRWQPEAVPGGELLRRRRAPSRRPRRSGSRGSSPPASGGATGRCRGPDGGVRDGPGRCTTRGRGCPTRRTRASRRHDGAVHAAEEVSLGGAVPAVLHLHPTPVRRHRQQPRGLGCTDGVDDQPAGLDRLRVRRRTPGPPRPPESSRPGGLSTELRRKPVAPWPDPSSMAPPGAQAPEERRAGMSITVRGLPADHLLSHTWSTRAHLAGPHLP